MENMLNLLSTRNGFNASLRHFKVANGILGQFQKKVNLADLINNALNRDKLKQHQVKSILNILLVDKFGYNTESLNIVKVSEDPVSDIADEVGTWTKLDFVVSYFHPQLGQLLINPKDKSSWENLGGGFKENELAVIYTGFFGAKCDKELVDKGTKALISLIQGDAVGNTDIFKGEKPAPVKKVVKQQPKQAAQQKQAPTVKKPAAAPKPTSSAKRKLSPRYGVIVANELFHNGNVEAWKKIITSYETKYPGVKVLVFYDNEEIKDLNTLFKWGKVKHGTMIYFSLLGTEFKSISKLRRYLAQGASHKFEAFLKGAPNQVLSLF